MKKKVIVK